MGETLGMFLVTGLLLAIGQLEQHVIVAVPDRKAKEGLGTVPLGALGRSDQVGGGMSVAVPGRMPQEELRVSVLPGFLGLTGQAQ
jgi:hypothetical protein